MKARSPLALLVALGALAASAGPATSERLVVSLSNHRVMVTSNFTGDELVLFGGIEQDSGSRPRRGGYDIVVRSEIGLIIWWFVLLGALVGLLPRANVPRAGWIATVVLAGFLMSLTGVGIILKALFGFANLAYSYYPTYNGYGPSPVPPSSFDAQQRSQQHHAGE